MTETLNSTGRIITGLLAWKLLVRNEITEEFFFTNRDVVIGNNRRLSDFVSDQIIYEISSWKEINGEKVLVLNSPPEMRQND